MKNSVCSITLFLALTGAVTATDYTKDILPILKEHCWDCHSSEKEVKGGLALDDIEGMRVSQINEFGIIRPGDPAKSDFLERLKLDDEEEDFMPKSGKALRSRDLALIETWIQGGAIIDKENLTDEEKARAAGPAMTGEAEGKGEFLPWTNLEGKTIEARYLGVEGKSVKILLRNGTSTTVPIAKLSADSVAQAKRLYTQQ